jgi:DNA-binding response OmpR family regulator
MGVKLGADDYVTKPFSLKELKARIETILVSRT